MKPEHLSYLRCPKTKKKLILSKGETENGKIKSGVLLEPESNNQYLIINFIPRFVPLENYAKNFGIEWNIHNRTQYDDASGFNISRERFFDSTKWNKKLNGDVILEAGSGSGRFTKHAAETEAMVVTFDFSDAVEANYKSNGNKENVLIVQASIFDMPFENNCFDKVFCFGVIQHTPDPKLAFMKLVEMGKKGSPLSTDIYIKSFTRWFLQTKYYVRPFFKNMDPVKMYSLVKRYIDFMWPIAKVIRKIPVIGPSLNWKLMIADDSRILLGADDKIIKEWSYLNTYDMLSPTYDIPKTFGTFKKWHLQAGLTNIEIEKTGHGLVGRGVK